MADGGPRHGACCHRLRRFAGYEYCQSALVGCPFSFRSTPSLQLRVRVQLASPGDAALLAAAAPPCAALRVLPPPCRRCSPDAWAAQGRLSAAVAALLRCAAFRARCAPRLQELHGCPLPAAEAVGALSAFTRLEALTLDQGMTIGCPVALAGSRLNGCPPSLRALEVRRGAAGCKAAGCSGGARVAPAVRRATL